MNALRNLRKGDAGIRLAIKHAVILNINAFESPVSQFPAGIIVNGLRITHQIVPIDDASTL